ncbi:MAG: DUF4238 domain-containing protein [Chloroflexi bacterium]|nr:MAG: DUF4238 domain-containing protein [Chloroflexota bacterium]
MEYKNQHFITEAYLRAWCDPNTPNGAFVWIVSKKDHSISRKSPRSLFSESDFYTIYDAGGNRNLELEHQLKDVEDKFIVLRDKKLKKHLPLTPDDRKVIALFVSTMFARTKRYKEEDKQTWQEYIDFIETLPQELAKQVKQTEEYNKVLELHKDQPMPFRLFTFVNMAFSYVYLMNCVIYETKTLPGLITSDNPCFWFDPAVYDPNKPLTFYGIGSPTLNIIMPISPSQYISLEMKGPDGYRTINTDPRNEEELVDIINGFTATNSDEFIVVNQKFYKEKWFDEGE